VLWVKFWSDASLSNTWTAAAAGLAEFVAQRPEYRTRYRAVGSYLATKLLTGHVRDGRYGALVPDWKRLAAAGLLDLNVPRLIGNHRAVSRYRRAMSSGEALATLDGPPETWR
jgi:hypothetical protein